jgi:hypothetical protein
MSFARKPKVLKNTNKLACSKTRFNENFCPEAWKIREYINTSFEHRKKETQILRKESWW